MQIKAPVITAFMSIMSLIAFGSWAFRLLEDWTWGQSFYFSVATLTTVGYGDLHPTTDESRIFTAIFILVGVGIVIAALTSIGGRFLSTQETQLSNRITRRINRHEEKLVEQAAKKAKKN